MFYFAYGSNLNHQQMESRCPDSIFLCRAYLTGYKFVYDGYSSYRKGSVANVIIKDGSIVWGGLYEISEKDLDSLDKCEGYPNTYNRMKLIVKVDKGKSYTVHVYLREAKRVGLPTGDYKEIIIEGAKDCRLPKDYIEANF